MNKTRKILSLMIIFSLLIGIAIGFGLGELRGVDWCVSKGLKFLEVQNISIGVNEDMLQNKINIYKGFVNQFLP